MSKSGSETVGSSYMEHEQIQVVPRFWSALETLSGQTAVAAWWRQLLGAEYPLVQTWLMPGPAWDSVNSCG